MNIHFEDEDQDQGYSEGMEDFAVCIGSSESETVAIGTGLSTSRVTQSEPTRTLTFQRATVRDRPPSPMNIDSGADEMQVEERTSFKHDHRPPPADPCSSRPAAAINSVTTINTATRLPSPTSGMCLTTAVAVPSKRATVTDEASDPSSPSPSPDTIAQPGPAKRPHTNMSANPLPVNKPEFGTKLDPFIIAHDRSVQSLLDANSLAWGTVYEIARGVTKGLWTWSDVTKEKVNQLRGTNARAANKVTAVILHHREPPPDAAAELWTEYDREQDAILENQGRGLGGMGAWKGKDDWYGGRIQQVGRLVRKNNQYFIQLEKPEIRRSHRFSRFLGSRRIMQVRVPDNLLYNKQGEAVRLLLSSHKFILCGRVFLPFHAKEGSLYMMETNQDFEREAGIHDGDQLRLSLWDFTDWHNSLRRNNKQPISKWSTRWALGLSTSVPTIELDPQHIYEIEDINVSPKDWEGKTPAEKVLTDGCGFINGAALTQIMRAMKYGSRPTAVQGRIGGSKGMWVLHPDPLEQVSDGPAKIWIRPSQTKIKLGSPFHLGRAQRIFDLLAPSRVTGPSRLSSQTLVNLSHNGIDHELLKELMSIGLKEEIKPFVDWTQPQSMIMVWNSVEKAGHTSMTRIRRMLAGKARALGLGQLRPTDDYSQEEEEEEEEGDQSQLPADIGHRKFSGLPITLHETVLELLQAGFHPLRLDHLFQKLESVISLVLDDYVEKFHIPVKESCEAYIVPDPYGVLEEGQIHFRSSEMMISPSTGEQFDIILGDVLISRNPTRLPSDIQKVKAVAHPKLSNYFNVIVFPIKGKQSLASFLGGGDYDGDTVMLNWFKPLVDQFRGSPLSTAPERLSEFFEREVEHVRDFDRRISKLEEPKLAQQAIQKVLLLGLAETRVGLYSKFHDTAVYKYGYADPKAIQLAYMFTTCLDASKTGLRVKLPVFDSDMKCWGSKKPWYAHKLEEGKGKNNDRVEVLRQRDPQAFILDALVQEGDNLRRESLEEYRRLKVQVTKEDQDLSRPWNEAKARAKQAQDNHRISGFTENLEDIQAHVTEVLGSFRRAVETYSRNPHAAAALFEKVASLFANQPRFRGFVFFSDDDIRTLKASYASTLSLSFAFSVAFHDLCCIKAKATGNVAITHQFAQCVTVPTLVARTFSQVYGSDMDSEP